MQDESLFRKSAREAIDHGRLPGTRPDRTTWVGRGSGAACAVCLETVTHDQMAMEIEYTRPKRIQYSLHTKCFSAWESELAEVDRDMLRGRASDSR
jgi:hypothetical protein